MSFVLERRQVVARPLEETFRFYEEPRNLERITPPWLKFRMVSGESLSMRHGLRIHYRVHPFGFPMAWTSEITTYEPPYRFVDEQVSGPYRRWHHTHEFRAAGTGTEIIDRVEYDLPFGPLGRIAHAVMVKRQLRAIFDYRERAVRELFG